MKLLEWGYRLTDNPNFSQNQIIVNWGACF